VIKNYKIILAFIFGFLILAAGFFNSPAGKNSLAQFSSVFGGFFGGKVSALYPCLDEGGYVITVGAPKGGNFYINTSTRIYARYTPISGVWVLGKANPGTVTCSNAGVPSGPNGSPVKFVGTSSLF
jgi:hypothetical protein